MELSIDKELITSITEGVKKAQDSSIEYLEVFTNSEVLEGENEFLFFIKPELTLSSEDIKIDKIFEMIFAKMQEFNLSIKNINILSANYLDKNNIIAQHYGVINSIASDAKNNLSEAAHNKFKELFGKEVNDCNVLGGIEFLEKYDFFNPLSLEYLWQNNKNVKLAGGTYCEEIKMDSETVYLVNGFHPSQLLHFTEKGRSIVTFTLVGNTNWSEARNNLIGATNPINAKEGSIRKILLEQKEQFGLDQVSQGMNGVHLSAGALEGLVELKRYNSNYNLSNGEKNYNNFSFGKKLINTFPKDKVETIISNPNVEFEGKNISLFDLTEEKNSEESISTLKEIF
ncbi:hypothetical protein ACE193_09320 [Bernardetia sp. OM2101]|uniref:hypothetical protein n=1 Tax=Bernardetia sp. OM2101 TaxID=3344876 RepID=UPI0035CF75DC